MHPIFIVLIGICFGIKIVPREYIGVLIVLVGCVIILSDPEAGKNFHGDSSDEVV